MREPSLKSMRTATIRAFVTLPIIGFFLACFSQFANGVQPPWSCLEAAHHSIYESTEPTDSRLEQTPQSLEWINQDTIGFHSFILRRSSQQSDAFVKNEGDFKALYINDKEVPSLVVLIEPQTWMNKFGYLRVRFYRCLP